MLGRGRQLLHRLPSVRQLATDAQKTLSRTLSLSDLPQSVQVKDLIDHIPSDYIESLSYLPEKNQVFVSFFNSQLATRYFTQNRRPDEPRSPGTPNPGFGRAGPIPVEVVAAVGIRNASRTVKIFHPNGLPDTLLPLEKELERFGPIERITNNKDGSVTYVNFFSTNVATKVVKTLRVESKWAKVAVSHPPITNLWTKATSEDVIEGKRTVILKGLPEDTTYRRLLERVNPSLPSFHPEPLFSTLLSAKENIAFLNFVDPSVAQIFYSSYSDPTTTGGVSAEWGKDDYKPSPSLLRAISLGARRTVWIGNIQDFDTLSVKRIRYDFARFGTVASVFLKREKKSAYVVYASIFDALRAIDRIHQNNRNFRAYAETYISFMGALPSTSHLRPLHILTSRSDVLLGPNTDTIDPPGIAEMSSAPTPVESSSSPAPVETSSAPTLVESSSSPAPVETSSSPVPAETSPAPTPVETTSPTAAPTA